MRVPSRRERDAREAILASGHFPTPESKRQMVTEWERSDQGRRKARWGLALGIATMLLAVPGALYQGYELGLAAGAGGQGTSPLTAHVGLAVDGEGGNEAGARCPGNETAGAGPAWPQ